MGSGFTGAADNNNNGTIHAPEADYLVLASGITMLSRNLSMVQENFELFLKLYDKGPIKNLHSSNNMDGLTYGKLIVKTDEGYSLSRRGTVLYESVEKVLLDLGIEIQYQKEVIDDLVGFTNCLIDPCTKWQILNLLKSNYFLTFDQIDNEIKFLKEKYSENGIGRGRKWLKFVKTPETRKEHLKEMLDKLERDGYAYKRDDSYRATELGLIKGDLAGRILLYFSEQMTTARIEELAKINISNFIDNTEYVTEKHNWVDLDTPSMQMWLVNAVFTGSKTAAIISDKDKDADLVWGILTEEHRKFLHLTAGDAASSPVEAIERKKTLGDADQKMDKYKIRHLPVVTENGREIRVGDIEHVLTKKSLDDYVEVLLSEPVMK